MAISLLVRAAWTRTSWVAGFGHWGLVINCGPSVATTGFETLFEAQMESLGEVGNEPAIFFTSRMGPHSSSVWHFFISNLLHAETKRQTPRIKKKSRNEILLVMILAKLKKERPWQDRSSILVVPFKNYWLSFLIQFLIHQ